MIERPTLRCAVYTRKSTDDGLEQDFNSLQAQREACEAFIRSQRGEGWALIATAYDDGGISGGTMERPALKRLLAHIEERRVDVVVVYKVDRLTRSLSDFSKMVDLFDRHGVSFVAVTQQFNTTTSMGRLTLNVLLSFAQFEREVTAERIRDKIAASKRKGIWVGGPLPRGYRVEDRKLIVVPEEAAAVRTIYTRYLKTPSVRELALELKRDGITATSDARPALSRGAIHALLRNPIYVGLIAHKGELHPGQHQGIIERDVWDSVQAKLKERRRHNSQRRKPEDSALRGKLYDEHGRLLMPYHVNKKDKRYGYYVSHTDDTDADHLHQIERINWRLAGCEIEGRVGEVVKMMLSDQAKVAHAAVAASLSTTELNVLLQTVRSALPADYLDWVERVTLYADHLSVTVVLPARIGVRLEHTVSVVMKRRGAERRLVIAPEVKTHVQPDRNILKAIHTGFRFWERLNSDQPLTAVQFAQQAGVDNRYIGRTLALAFLAPDLVERFASGNHPPEWTADRLLRWSPLLLSWEEQRKVVK
jgi:DNA invertase Pin-like site-specific DNA recombinase